MHVRRVAVAAVITLACVGLLPAGAAGSAPGAARTVVVTSHATTAAAGDGTTARTAAAAATYRLTYAKVNGRRTLIRWNPCRTLTYRINLARAPRTGVTEVRRAMRIVARALGVRLVDKGTTTHIPRRINTLTASARQPADLVVAWARPGSGKGRSDLLPGGNTLGVGGVRYAWGGGRKAQVEAGYVVLDSTKTKLYRPGFGTGLYAGGLYLHELGHAVALQHVDVRGQAMHGTLSAQQPSGYGAGDRTGLAKIGRKRGCIS